MVRRSSPRNDWAANAGLPSSPARQTSMTRINRVLDVEPCPSLADYCLAGGGNALEIVRLVEPEVTIEAILRSGLRGRGGAGFPTGTKWASVLANSSPMNPTPVVVNGAEGEPSTFKDRSILRSNPYRVLEGALIACHVFHSQELVVCLKKSFDREIQRVTDALAEMRLAGWLNGIEPRIVAGPGHYLFGEETALLEVVEGRQPFPRVTPPWRRGINDDDSGAAPGELANQQEGTGAPALVNNVETFANVALIARNGPEWFRQCGTKESPGTIVCTVSGDVISSGVGEFAMGTPLSEVIEALGDGPLPERRIVAVLPGASGGDRHRNGPRRPRDVRRLSEHRERVGIGRVPVPRRPPRPARPGVRCRPISVHRILWPVHGVQRRRVGRRSPAARLSRWFGRR